MSVVTRVLKRALDIGLSSAALAVTGPVVLTAATVIWLHDRKSPFYTPVRVGRGQTTFRMLKLRTMVSNADRIGGSSSSANDARITPPGRVLRQYKLDELPQFLNVLLGSMSVVGPRPQVEADVRSYTPVERGLLDAKPGITDFSSIVFSDEGEILAGSDDPDLAYNQLIRPYKSRLGLLYVQHAAPLLDLKLVALTGLAMASKRHALRGVVRILADLGADAALVRVASRSEPLQPATLPGSGES